MYKKSNKNEIDGGDSESLHHHETTEEIRVEVIPMMGLRGEIDTFETVTASETARRENRAIDECTPYFLKGRLGTYVETIPTKGTG